ncbi:MAG: GbsR/MarR family transcriptional regulator [Phycisphaerales bacterium]
MERRGTHDVGVKARAQDAFVRSWGQMAGAWGIGRTMAEAHALLYIVGEPLNSDEVMQRLQISRGNASMTLRSLVDWGLVQRVHKPGDRKEYFRADSDVWSMLRTILRERKKRELDPLLASLYEIRDMTRAEDGGASEHTARLDAMVEFVGLLDALAERVVSQEGSDLREAAETLADVMERADEEPSAARGRRKR